MPKAHLSLLSLFSLLFLISSSPIDTFVYGSCSQLNYAPGTPFQSNLNSLLTSLLTSASSSSYTNFTIYSPNQDSPLYGLYQCSGDISTVDCSRCVQNSITQLGVLCLDSCGGTIQLQGCFVKYDNVAFIGMQDKTLVVKKCGSTSNGYDNDLLSRRDGVLMELGSETGSFRVGTAGYVSGMAQCVGDLDGGECSDCISEAVERVRTGCGICVSVDVYLAKCYVRYSDGDVYPKARKGGKGDSPLNVTVTLTVTLSVTLSVTLTATVAFNIRKNYGRKPDTDNCRRSQTPSTRPSTPPSTPPVNNSGCSCGCGFGCGCGNGCGCGCGIIVTFPGEIVGIRNERTPYQNW